MKINCPQCGADIALQPRSIQLRCPFCETPLLLKKDLLLETYKVESTCEEKGAISLVHVLLQEKNRELKVVKTELIFLPFYRFLCEKKGKSHETVYSALRNPPVFLSSIPSGSIVPLDTKETIKKRNVEKNLSEITESMKAEKVQSLEEILLLYIPFYKITLSSGEIVWIDAVQGKVRSDSVLKKRPKTKRFTTLALTGLLIALVIEGILIPLGFLRPGIQIVTAGVFFYTMKRRLTDGN
jgi:hypothetical protein